MDRLALVLALGALGLVAAQRLAAWLRVEARRTGAGASAGTSNASSKVGEGAPIAEALRSLLLEHARWSGLLVGVAALGAFTVMVSMRTSPTIDSASPRVLAALAAGSTLVGGATSIVAAFVCAKFGLFVDVAAPAARRRAFPEGLVATMRGGAAAALFVVALALVSLGVLYGVASRFGPLSSEARATGAPMAIVGFAVGASLVALVAQLGFGVAGVASAAADARLRAAEPNSPLDDPRNTLSVVTRAASFARARIAPVAELFQSVAVEGVASMLLAAALFQANHGFFARVGVDAFGVVLVPLVVRAFSLIATFVGAMAVKSGPSESPMAAIDRGYFVSAVLVMLSVGTAAHWLLRGTFIWFAIAGALGVLVGYGFMLAARWQEGGAMGDESADAEGESDFVAGLGGAVVPAIVAALGAFGAYRCGEASGLSHGGVFALALAASGSLGVAGFLRAATSIDAGLEAPVVETSVGEKEARAALERAAPMIRAIGRGYAASVAALVVLVTLRADLYRVGAQRVLATGVHAPVEVDLTKPAILFSAALGATLVFAVVALVVRGIGAVDEATLAAAQGELQTLEHDETGVIFPIDYHPPYRVLARQLLGRSLAAMALPTGLVVVTPALLGVVLARAFGVGAEGTFAFAAVAAIVGVLLSLALAGGRRDRDAKSAAATSLREIAAPVLPIVAQLLAVLALALGPWLA